MHQMSSTATAPSTLMDLLLALLVFLNATPVDAQEVNKARPAEDREDEIKHTDGSKNSCKACLTSVKRVSGQGAKTATEGEKGPTNVTDWSFKAVSQREGHLLQLSGLPPDTWEEIWRRQ